jgi:hypothetical protein
MNVAGEKGGCLGVGIEVFSTSSACCKYLQDKKSIDPVNNKWPAGMCSQYAEVGKRGTYDVLLLDWPGLRLNKNSDEHHAP